MEQSLEHGGGSDRVRRHSRESANAEIDFELEQRIRFYATQDRSAIDARLAELEREWDIERTLEANAASVSLAGLFLGITVNRRWFALPMIVSGFLLQHAVQGWCPPLPIFRRLGFRTQKEIDRERYALKALRGDFGDQPENHDPEKLILATQ